MQGRFFDAIKSIRDNLKKIDSQEVVSEGILNEEYDDWYHDSGESFIEEEGRK